MHYEYQDFQHFKNSYACFLLQCCLDLHSSQGNIYRISCELVMNLFFCSVTQQMLLHCLLYVRCDHAQVCSLLPLSSTCIQLSPLFHLLESPFLLSHDLSFSSLNLSAHTYIILNLDFTCKKKYIVFFFLNLTDFFA